MNARAQLKNSFHREPTRQDSIQFQGIDVDVGVDVDAGIDVGRDRLELDRDDVVVVDDGAAQNDVTVANFNCGLEIKKKFLTQRQ